MSIFKLNRIVFISILGFSFVAHAAGSGQKPASNDEKVTIKGDSRVQHIRTSPRSMNRAYAQMVQMRQQEINDTPFVKNGLYRPYFKINAFKAPADATADFPPDGWNPEGRTPVFALTSEERIRMADDGLSSARYMHRILTDYPNCVTQLLQGAHSLMSYSGEKGAQLRQLVEARGREAENRLEIKGFQFDITPIPGFGFSVTPSIEYFHNGKTTVVRGKNVRNKVDNYQCKIDDTNSLATTLLDSYREMSKDHILKRQTARLMAEENQLGAQIEAKEKAAQEYQEKVDRQKDFNEFMDPMGTGR